MEKDKKPSKIISITRFVDGIIRGLVVFVVATYMAWSWFIEQHVFPAIDDISISLLNKDGVVEIGKTLYYNVETRKLRNCPVIVERFFVDDTDRKFKITPYTRRIRLPGVINVNIKTFVPNEMTPGKGWFWVRVRYKCNVLKEFVYESNKVRVTYR